MDNIDLPLYLAAEHDGEFLQQPVQACFRLYIGNTTSKGIHMSRLYQLLGELAELQSITPDTLLEVLKQAIFGQEEGIASTFNLKL